MFVMGFVAVLLTNGITINVVAADSCIGAGL
jgi:hypothetical protein